MKKINYFKIKAGSIPVMVVFAVLIFSSCGNLIYDFAKKYERGKAGFEEFSVEIAGHNIVYLEAGEGETLVLVHGFGGDKDNWTRMAAHLRGRFRIIAPDMPGFGESDRIEDEKYSIQNQTERLAAFTEELGLDSFHLAGNSMGGWISAWYAVNYPERVKSVTLLNSAGVNSPEKSQLQIEFEDGSGTLLDTLLIRDIKDYDRLLKLMFVNPPYIPGPVKRRLAEEAVNNREFNRKIWNDVREDLLDLEPYLGRINAPAFIVWGDSDIITHPSSVEVFTSGIKNSESLIFEECGHVPMLEKPKETAEALEKFISGT